VNESTKVTAEIREKNSEIYDETSGLVWNLAVYEGAHGGWEFINLGGVAVAETIARRACLSPGKQIAELCAGQGAICRYLAGGFGVSVVGVEWNGKQVRKARERLAKAPDELSRLVRIVEADCTTWIAPHPMDLVYSVDAMMLLPDVRETLRRSFENVKPGCPLMVATIGAGAAATNQIRDFAWDVDGMLSLYDIPQYEFLFEEAGFQNVAVEDLTHLAIQASEKIEDALRKHRDTIVSSEGEAVYRGWIDVGRVYLDAFRQNKLAYLLVSGQRSGCLKVNDNFATSEKALLRDST